MKKFEVVEKLIEKTGRSEEECNILNEILDSHFVIGRNNKEKIVSDIMEKLNVTVEDADNLYNICMETIVKGVFGK